MSDDSFRAFDRGVLRHDAVVPPNPRWSQRPSRLESLSQALVVQAPMLPVLLVRLKNFFEH